MLLIVLAAATAACLPGKVETDPVSTPEACAYERLMACYVAVMESKGLKLDSPDRLLIRYDPVARHQCKEEIAAYRRQVGPAATERDWKGLWDEYWSRL